MSSYALNSFAGLASKVVLDECLKEIHERSSSQGAPNHFCITLESIGGNEFILLNDISSLDEVIRQLIDILNGREWNDDDLYVSIEGVYTSKDLITPLYVEVLNDDPDSDF